MSGLRIEGLRLGSDLGPIDLAVAPGECIAITGPSGSGKTRILRALADLDVHQGRVFLDGEECASVRAPEWRRRVGLLLAESAWWHERVDAHFAPDAPSPEAFAALGLAPSVREASVARLSAGERQRLSLLRLLANRPQALLLDEPTTHLDVENRERVERLVTTYRQERSAPVLWVTHDPVQAQSVAIRRYGLVGGALQELDA